jgi:hypothetical protein
MPRNELSTVEMSLILQVLEHGPLNKFLLMLSESTVWNPMSNSNLEIGLLNCEWIFCKFNLEYFFSKLIL